MYEFKYFPSSLSVIVFKKNPLYRDKSVVIVNFQSFLSEFDIEGYMPLIMNMKREVNHLLFKLSHNFASHIASYCQDDTAEAHWLRKKTFPFLSYSSDFTKRFFETSGHFFCTKIFHFKGKVKTGFKNFLESKPLDFYCVSINYLVNRWPKSISRRIKKLFKYINSRIKVYSKIGQ